MPKFLPARLVPYIFSGVPTPTASYDVLTYSATSLIAPFELAVNEANNSLILESNGSVHEFFASGSTVIYHPSTGASGVYVFVSGDTMTGDLSLTSSNIYLDNSQGILMGDSGTSIGGHIRLIDNGRIQISAATQIEIFGDLNTSDNIELNGSQIEWQNGGYQSFLSPASLSTGRTWSLPDNDGKIIAVPSSGQTSGVNSILQVDEFGVPYYAPELNFSKLIYDYSVSYPATAITAGYETLNSDVVFYDSSVQTGLTQGQIYSYSGYAPWEVTASSSTIPTKQIVVAMGSDGELTGYLREGYIAIDNTMFPTPPSVGDIIYMSEDATAPYAATAPTTSGTYQKKIGWIADEVAIGRDQYYVLYFQPSTYESLNP